MKKKLIVIKLKFGINLFKLNNLKVFKMKQYNNKMRTRNINIAQNMNNKDTTHILILS